MIISICRDQTKILLGKNFNSPIEDVLTTDRLVFGDYLVPGADPRVYTQVTDMTRLVKVCRFTCALPTVTIRQMPSHASWPACSHS